MKRRKQAQVILICVIFLPLFLMLVMMLFSQTVSRIYSSRHDRRAQTAQFAAESALAKTIANLRRDSKFAGPVEVKFQELDSAGLVHFDGTRPFASINNGTDGPLALPGSKVFVYPHQIHLVAVGSCNGVQIVKEVRLSTPDFPFCIYASGKFTSAGGLLLGAVKPGVDVHDVHAAQDLLPAEMLANASGSDSLVLEGDSTIVGSPKTPGAARVGARVKVLQGEVQSGARAQEPPIVQISEYDPAGRPGLQTLAQSSFSVREPMSGLVRFSGPQLTFNQGLELKGGVLFVEGNLTVGAGGIRGQGAVICTGNVTITGSSDLAADSRCAVVAGGDVSLAGSGPDGSYYQGLLYAGGDGGISVSGVTLLGAAVASHPAGATVEMHDTRVVFDPQATHVRIPL